MSCIYVQFTVRVRENERKVNKIVITTTERLDEGLLAGIRPNQKYIYAHRSTSEKNPFSEHTIRRYDTFGTLNNHNFHCLHFVMWRSGFFTLNESDIKIVERE